jgi:hypothetical protein
MSVHPLSILKVKSSNTKPDFDLPDPFPKHHFSALITAPSRSGKSFLLINMLYHPSINLKSHFDEIYFISPTLSLDSTLKAIVKDDDIIKIEDDEDLENLDVILKEIIKNQKETDEDDRKNVLIICDDMIDYLKKSKVLSNLFTKNRHYSISIVLSAQAYRDAYSPKVRKNATCHIIFKMYNKKDIDAINEEIFSGFEDGLKHYKEATEKPFSFLFCNCRDMELYERFEHKLWSKY